MNKEAKQVSRRRLLKAGTTALAVAGSNAVQANTMKPAASPTEADSSGSFAKQILSSQ